MPMCEKYYIWNPATFSSENGKYLGSIIDDSVITFDDLCSRNKNGYKKFQWKNVICKTKSFYILLTFLLITIALLIAVIIYFCPIKYNANQKHLLPYYLTNNKLKQVL